MDKDLKRQLNTLEGIKPSDDFKSSLKTELFGEEKSFFLQLVQPEFAFGSLAMAACLFAFIIIGSYKPFPNVERVENKISPRIAQLVEDMQEEKEEKDGQMGMMAMESEETIEEEEKTMVAKINFDDISDEDLAKLPKEEREELKKDIDKVLAKIRETEEGIAGVMAVQKEVEKELQK